MDQGPSYKVDMCWYSLLQILGNGTVHLLLSQLGLLLSVYLFIGPPSLLFFVICNSI